MKNFLKNFGILKTLSRNKWEHYPELILSKKSTKELREIVATGKKWLELTEDVRLADAQEKTEMILDKDAQRYVGYEPHSLYLMLMEMDSRDERLIEKIEEVLKKLQ